MHRWLASRWTRQTKLTLVTPALYERSDLERVKWQDVLPSDVVQEAAIDLLWNLKGRPKQLQPLDLDEYPDLKELIQALDEEMAV